MAFPQLYSFRFLAGSVLNFWFIFDSHPAAELIPSQFSFPFQLNCSRVCWESNQDHLAQTHSRACGPQLRVTAKFSFAQKNHNKEENTPWVQENHPWTHRAPPECIGVCRKLLICVFLYKVDEKGGEDEHQKANVPGSHKLLEKSRREFKSQKRVLVRSKLSNIYRDFVHSHVIWFW